MAMNCQVNPSQRAAIEGLKFALEKIQARSGNRGAVPAERFCCSGAFFCVGNRMGFTMKKRMILPEV